MPLSEEELRLLEQMERALSEEDPKFASTLRGTSLRRVARRRAMAAGAVFVVGIVLSLAGLLVPIPLMALDLLTGAVQAYIFAVLATVFIGAAVSGEVAENPRKDTH